MDKTSICNQALVECEVDATISSVDTDDSVEAQRMRRLYNATKAECISLTNWTFATKYVYLSNVEKPTDCPYGYAFQYPTNALRLEGIYEDSTAVQNKDNGLTYAVGTNINGSQKLLFCDIEKPIAKILLNVNDDILPPLFCRFLYLTLAYKYSKIAGASDGVKERLYQEMQIALKQSEELNAQVSNNLLNDEANYYVDVRS